MRQRDFRTTRHDRRAACHTQVTVSLLRLSQHCTSSKPARGGGGGGGGDERNRESAQFAPLCTGLGFTGGLRGSPAMQNVR